MTKDKDGRKLDSAEVRFVRNVAEYKRTGLKHNYFGETLKILTLNNFMHYRNKLWFACRGSTLCYVNKIAN